MSSHRPFPRRARNRWLPITALVLCAVVTGWLVIEAFAAQPGI